jgi:hypothetical protein
MAKTEILLKGYAAEMLVAGNLILGGIPSFLCPPNWEKYDIIAEPPGRKQQRISVKCRGSSYIDFRPDEFDWLAIMLIKDKSNRFFIIPSAVAKEQSAKKTSKKGPGLHTINHKTVPEKFCKYENNFCLNP